MSLFTASVFALSLFAHAGPLPAPLVPDETTQGTLCSTQDPDFKEFRYKENIPYCHREVSGSLKHSIYNHYGIPQGCRYQYTIDHFYPLSLGGNNARENLWPEHHEIKKSRQNLETRLFYEIRKGNITQDEALKEIEMFKLNPRVDKIISGNYCDLHRFVPGSR